MNSFGYFLFVLILNICVIKVTSLNYEVQWLGGSTIIERDTGHNKQSVNIYCYAGINKNILSLWQTVKFHIKINNNEFTQYLGGSPAEVYKEYTEDSYGWAVVNPFQTKTYKTLSIDLFNTTCMAIHTKHRHSIELQVIRIDIWRVSLMFLGISLIFLSRSLSGNPVFFYLCGIFIGVSASFMVLVYYISKLLPKKTLTYGILIGGWTVGVYIFQQLWENMHSIIISYQTYMFWYVTLVSFISFLVCYRIGPPQNERSKNLVMWTLQAVGVLMIFLSSNYQEASTAIVVLTFVIKYFPQSLLILVKGHWRKKFPPKVNFLTNEEYYAEGARETKHALEELRKHCSSPDCAQWKIILKLNDSKRFASFVEGESHLSDDEVINYETYAFSQAKPKPRKIDFVTSSPANDSDISDDDSSDSETE